MPLRSAHSADSSATGQEKEKEKERTLSETFVSRGRRTSKVVLALIAAAAVLAGPGAGEPARAQPAVASGRPQGQSASADKGRAEGSLRGSMGVAVAARLLASDNAADRLRGVERLGSLGTTEAIDALIEALEQGTAASRDPKARLLAVRALADHAKRDAVRQLLAREIGDSAGSEGRGAASPLSALTRSTAALALARSASEKKALAPLVTALLQGGAPAEAAARAFVAYPPTSLAPFLEGKKRLSTQLATYLGELGDLRAIERLRTMLTEPDPAGKIAAALALAKLGDEAALAPARAWLAKSEPRGRRAAAEVLTLLGAADAPQAIGALLGVEALRLDGVRLAQRAPSPTLALALAAALSALPEVDRPQVVAALGLASGPEAVKQLQNLLTKPDLAVDAAYALATMPEAAAREALSAALGKAESDKTLERILLRACLLRALVLRDPPDVLASKLDARLTSKDPTDRAIAAFGLVATGARDTSTLLADVCPRAAAQGSGSAWRSTVAAPGAASSPAPACDEVVVRAAARGALSRGPSAIEPFMGLLEAVGGADPSAPGASFAPETAVAAGVALLVHPDGGDLPTSVLAAWAEAGGPLAPLAARALPTRDDEALRGRMKRLLSGSDPVVRAHVALGLGADPEPSAVSLLTSAYRFEEEASVRRAIVRALSRRTETQRLKTLALARDLDPDPGVRALARSALEGRVLTDAPPGPSSVALWITLAANDPSAVSAAQNRSARVVRADGIAVPVVADPDGVLLVPGVPPGPVSLFLSRAGRAGSQ